MMNLEKKAPFPFKKIAVAIGFTPRTEAILAESYRLQKLFGSTLIFIHIGEKSLQQEQYLKHLLHRFELDGPNNKIIWEQGDPVDQIISICENEQVDLLVAGALVKESMLKYILGGIARNLCRKAKCSVLMLREPNIKSQPIKRIVVEGSDNYKTATTIEAAIYVAKTMRTQQVFVIQEEDAGKMAIIRSDASNDLRKKQAITEELNKLIAEGIVQSDGSSVYNKVVFTFIYYHSANKIQ